MKKVHLYINPRNGDNVCRVSIPEDERYRWESYMVNPVSFTTCKRCMWWWKPKRKKLGRGGA